MQKPYLSLYIMLFCIMLVFKCFFVLNTHSITKRVDLFIAMDY